MFNLIRPVFKIMLTVFLTFTASPPEAAAGGCPGPHQVGEATLSEILQFVQEKKMVVLTFAGFSGAAYENPAGMLENASEILRKQDPEKTLINIGATRDGIGAVYEVAKAMGFTTMGIVSSLAQAEGVALSPCVDYVFYVQDDSWGGRVRGEERLSPTSEAIVEVSFRLRRHRRRRGRPGRAVRGPQAGKAGGLHPGGHEPQARQRKGPEAGRTRAHRLSRFGACRVGGGDHSRSVALLQSSPADSRKPFRYPVKTLIFEVSLEIDAVLSRPVPDRHPVDPQKPGRLGLISPRLPQCFEQGGLFPRNAPLPETAARPAKSRCELRRQVLAFHLAGIGNHEGIGQGALELAHVSRPAVVHEKPQNIRCQGRDRLSPCLCEGFE